MKNFFTDDRERIPTKTAYLVGAHYYGAAICGLLGLFSNVPVQCFVAGLFCLLVARFLWLTQPVRRRA